MRDNGDGGDDVMMRMVLLVCSLGVYQELSCAPLLFSHLAHTSLRNRPCQNVCQQLSKMCFREGSSASVQ